MSGDGWIGVGFGAIGMGFGLAAWYRARLAHLVAQRSEVTWERVRTTLGAEIKIVFGRKLGQLAEDGKDTRDRVAALVRASHAHASFLKEQQRTQDEMGRVIGLMLAGERPMDTATLDLMRAGEGGGPVADFGEADPEPDPGPDTLAHWDGDDLRLLAVPYQDDKPLVHYRRDREAKPGTTENGGAP